MRGVWADSGAEMWESNGNYWLRQATVVGSYLAGSADGAPISGCSAPIQGAAEPAILTGSEPTPFTTALKVGALAAIRSNPIPAPVWASDPVLTGVATTAPSRPRKPQERLNDTIMGQPARRRAAARHGPGSPG